MSDPSTAKSSNPMGQKSVLMEFLVDVLFCYIFYLIVKFVFNLISEAFINDLPGWIQVQLEKELKKEIEKNNKLKDEMEQLKYKLGEAEGRAIN